MDPVIDTDWLGFKNDPIDEPHSLGNIARSWQWRERGINPPNSASNKTVLENIAEDILVQKPLKIRCCDLPGYPRSTFLMVFSPDGTKVASTHANHDVYVSELASGKHVRILKGHPRTPWCIAFHPSHPQLIGSGCLGGQVRVWDISSGGSEVWNVRNESVIASIAFHPRKQLLVIATYNELYFWDWSQPAPFTKVSTNTINEKVRYVAFDSLGYKLITGIALWTIPSNPINIHQNNASPNNNQNNHRRDEPDDNPESGRSQDSNGATQDLIVNSYQNLVQRYDSLVRNYQRLFMVRHRLSATPSPPSTTDRGTDPMETDPSPESNSYTRVARTYSVAPQEDDENSTTREETDPLSSGDAETPTSRIFNLDALSFDSTSTRDPDTTRSEHSIFGSRQSAFQPLNDSSGGRTFRTVDQRERTSRLLPNPFSSTNVTPRPSRFSFSDNSLGQEREDSNANSSRTSIFPAYRSETPPGVLDLSSRRLTELSALNENLRNAANMTTERDSPSTSGTNNTPRQTSSSNTLPMSGPVDAQTINESLDLIRDILRDSGTRLLNLITNMSLSTLANVERRERSLPRRRTNSRAQSDENEGSERSRTTRPRVRLFSSSLRQEFLSSSSESDSDQSPEVNIFRTRNSTFREDNLRHPTRPSTDVPLIRLMRPTDRLVFELGEQQLNDSTHESGGINVTSNSSRFHVRSQSNVPEPDPEPSTSTRDNSVNTEQRSQNNPDFDPNRPSTSRDNFWAGGAIFPPHEAYRKVRGGVNALQKHTMQLTNLWLRGNRITNRELRNMWENLRRRILMLHRETGRQDMPTYYTRSLLERCMMLSDMTDNITRGSSRTSRTNPRFQESTRDAETDNDIPMNTQGDINLNNNAPSTSMGSTGDTRTTLPHRSPQARHTSSMRFSPALRRRSTGFRIRLEEEIRRRSRNSAAVRLSQRNSTRPRREFVRAVEMSATRHEIRMRAMQVLSVMFNMMMMCLEERGLSQLIINMLRTLKKALALTCLMLMTNRNGGRRSSTASPQRVDSANVIRLENIDNSEPINVDGPDEPQQNSVQNETEEVRTHNDINNAKHVKREPPTNSKASTSTANNTTENIPSTPNVSVTQRWSNRLAVQIAAANRNNSATARNRRELYMESKRLKALHRTNPIAHPLAKRKVLPPVSTYRIPALRLPLRKSAARTQTAPRIQPIPNEPVAGPSGININNNSSSAPPRLNIQAMQEFEYRINLIRMAHMQAVRLRSAARNRFRRLQTIRLYTPSSVRGMFNLPPNNDTQQENRSYLPNGTEPNTRRSSAWYEYTPRLRDRILYRSPLRNSDESGQFQAVISNAAVPLMQVGDLPPGNSETQGNQPLRRSRIHEYLQPIILAQNAMVVEEEGAGEGGAGGGAARRLGGMAGLLDAGIISEALPALSHRVQAWDFSAGVPPDIADSTKNIVVQRCRIHNDASIDISKDGRLLVALLPVPRLRNTNHWLGVYSLEWSRLGQCLHTAAFEHSAVSVALSPTARHLAVGLGARRFSSAPARTNVFALLYRLDPLESSSRTGLSPIKELEQTWEHGFTSLNCLRWAPQPGQGLMYADNTGQLIIMS